MADIRILRGPRIVPDVDQALQFAGYKEGGLGRDKSLIRCQELVTILRPLMQAKAALAFTDDTLYAVLTLGAAVSRKLDEYEKDGDVMDSLLFNALADTCLMALEEEVLQQLQLICKQKGCGITGRHEPGSDIPLSSQADAVAETKAGQSLGVSVNKDLVLSPAKSMTLVFDIDSDPKVFHAAHDCASCPKTDCDRRKDSGEAVVTVPAGVKVDEAIQAQGTDLSMPCGGKGRCGKCRVRVVAGKLAVTPADRNVFSDSQLREGWRLACQAETTEETKIAVPLREQQGFSALALQEDAEQDSALLANHGCGIAIDIGTTTIAAALVDRTDGRIVATATTASRQRSFGADVISRIDAANKGKGKALQKAVRKDILGLMETLFDDHPEGRTSCRAVAIAANTTMLHLLMGWSCKGLGNWPFTPVSLGGETYAFKDVFGSDFLSDCPVTLIPGMSTYVGGDITAGIAASGLMDSDEVTLFIDLGTNGELVLGNRDQRFIASAPAGPALEGGKLTWGTASISGAICGVRIEGSKAIVRTIDGAVPVGICGTGIIEAMAGLVSAGLVDETGKLEEPYFSMGFTLGSTLDYERIVLSQKDIREIQMAKSAIRAGIETLIEGSGMDRRRIDRVCLAGGFGYRLDPEKAAVIGLLPPDLADKATAVGNTALQGAAALVAGTLSIQDLQDAASGAEERVLGNEEAFQRLYISYMNF